LPNALDPNLMSAAERLTEIGEILAAGLLRLRAKGYKSLSAIARAITGTRWNGPLWFGLRNHRSAK
jgi:hypothetical protein